MRVCCSLLALAGAQQNPPVWPGSVQVFGPGDTGIADAVNAAYATNGGKKDHGQFATKNFAFLFKPGFYTDDIPVGFYTQVLGLGMSPNDVEFAGPKGVYCEEGSTDYHVGALDTFWRGAEGFRSTSNYTWFGETSGMLWAVSQAAPLRRVHVDNDLLLFQYEKGDAAGYASGGFMADAQVDGSVLSGSQQQWMTRNSQIFSFPNGVLNMVFVGVEGAPAGSCGQHANAIPSVTVDEAPVIAEKPFITIDTEGLYYLNIPVVRRSARGVDTETPQQVGFEQVFVAREGDTAAEINVQLAKGMHVVISPGTYVFEETLKVTVANTVILGLGLPILVAGNGDSIIQVGDVDGVRVAGMIFEAGPVASRTLIQWGTGLYAGSPLNPGVMSDIYGRVGGPGRYPNVLTTKMVTVASGHVVGDNLWLWRADHTAAGVTTPVDNRCQHGLEVTGDDVTMYGLAVEHTLQDLTLWTGERGRTFFYQSELPYGVDQQQWGDAGYVGYRVGPIVQSHEAWGVGVYHYFRDHSVTAQSGIACPDHLVPYFHSPLTVFLNGNGVVKHVINQLGNASGVGAAGSTHYCPSASKIPQEQCNVGDVVSCSGTFWGTACRGNQCCPDSSTCPSASADFAGCPKPKAVDCTAGATGIFVV